MIQLRWHRSLHYILRERCCTCPCLYGNYMTNRKKDQKSMNKCFATEVCEWLISWIWDVFFKVYTANSKNILSLRTLLSNVHQGLQSKKFNLKTKTLWTRNCQKSVPSSDFRTPLFHRLLPLRSSNNFYWWSYEVFLRLCSKWKLSSELNRSKTTMFKVTGSMVLALGCVVIGVGENSSIFAHVSGDKSLSKNNANLELNSSPKLVACPMISLI